MSTTDFAAANTLTQQLQHIRAAIAHLDVETLARQTGFLKRTPRKIPMADWLLALIALSAETLLSLERVAAVIGLVAQQTYTKQALAKRLNATVEAFLAQVAATLFGELSQDVRHQGLFQPFQRVLLQDSTTQALPAHLAGEFPASGNHHPRKHAAFKLQFITDLLHGTVLHAALSGFTRNDQAAAPDILQVAQSGDLIIRDLGYFALPVLAQLDLRGGFFLSRFKHGVGVYDLHGQPLDLAWLLKIAGRVDQEVLLGAGKVRVRLVALPVPDSVANERRRKARNHKPHLYPPSRELLFFMGWNLFITNVKETHWPTQAFQPLYRLRWRIEIIFKTWKSHLGWRQCNARSAALLRLSVMTKLLFCILVHRCCNALELLGTGTQQVSLLRLARIMGQCAGLFAATLLNLTPLQWLQHHLENHLFYERRKDRKNFFELLAEVNGGLG